jgi:transcriptional regulator with XRE-family HTH domain
MAGSSDRTKHKRTAQSASSVINDTESPEARIAGRVTGLRKAQRLTLDVLTKRTGLSKGYLSKIENGRSIPPIGTLARIASALGTDVAYFMQDSAAHETERISVVRVGERKAVVRGGSQFGYDYLSLAHKRRFKGMEPFVFRFPKKYKSQVRFEHEGEEFLFVLSGQIDFEIGDRKNRQSWILEAGDSIYFDSSQPHKGRSLTDDATALVVILNNTGLPAP